MRYSRNLKTSYADEMQQKHIDQQMRELTD